MQSNQSTLLAIETFLVGFSKTSFVDEAIVRGSYITRNYMGKYQRQCKDLDLLYLQAYAPDKIKTLLHESICHAATEQELVFDAETIQFDEIWKLSLSPGIRATISFVYLGKKGTLQIDIAANDPLIIEPVACAVGGEFYSKVMIKTVALEIALAWKFHGLFEHLNGAWMSKTLWDLYVMCRQNSLNTELLRNAIHLAFESRLDPVDISKRFFYGDFGQSKTSQRQWKRDVIEFSAGQQPRSMKEVLSWLRSYLLKVLNIEDDATLLVHRDVITYRVKMLRFLNTEDARAKLKNLNRKTRVLATKAYYSIPHLPGSRTGEADRTIDNSKANMLTQKSVTHDDVVTIQEKLDGSCVCAYRRGDDILALGRDGDLASESPNESRQLWSDWVDVHQARFLALLNDGERVCGEWLAMAHGTRYELQHEPFVAFDLFDNDNKAISCAELKSRCEVQSFTNPHIIYTGGPCQIDDALRLLDKGYHGSLDLPEGLVWRLERNGRLLFKAKYVRKDKIDGSFLTEITGEKELWNWFPKERNQEE
ncbi:MAG: RNA ligase family protein [Arenicella sp.]